MKKQKQKQNENEKKIQINQKNATQRVLPSYTTKNKQKYRETNHDQFNK